MKLSRLWKKKKVSPYGVFPWKGTWDEAYRSTTTYESDFIGQTIAKQHEAFLKQLEADNFVIDTRKEQHWRTEQILAALAVVFSKEHLRKVRVLDFGGASCAYYYLLQHALPEIEFEWLAVETPQMTQAHQTYVTKHLRWQTGLPAPVAGTTEKPFDICMANFSLQYVGNPYEIMEKLAALGRYLIFNSVPLMDIPEDRIGIQRIPPVVHETTHPHWVFSERKFLEFLSNKGEVKLRWISPRDEKKFEDRPLVFKGQLIELRPA